MLYKQKRTLFFWDAWGIGCIRTSLYAMEHCPCSKCFRKIITITYIRHTFGTAILLIFKKNPYDWIDLEFVQCQSFMFYVKKVYLPTCGCLPTCDCFISSLRNLFLSTLPADKPKCLKSSIKPYAEQQRRNVYSLQTHCQTIQTVHDTPLMKHVPAIVNVFGPTDWTLGFE